MSDKSKLAAALFAPFFRSTWWIRFLHGNSKQGYKRIGITLLAFIPILLPFVLLANAIWNIIITIQVLTSKTGSKWHQDAQGLELQD